MYKKEFSPMTSSDQQLKKRAYKPYDDSVSLGANIILKCSACGLPLVDILVTRPKLEVETIVKAICWKCNDKSFQQKVKGGFHQTKTKYSIPSEVDTNQLDDGTLDVTIHTVENKNKDDGKV